MPTIEVITEASCELAEVKGVLVEHDEDYGSDDDRDPSGYLSPATCVKRVIVERDTFKAQLLRLAEFTNVHRSIEGETKPDEIATWVEQSITSEVTGLRKRVAGLKTLGDVEDVIVGLKKTITQLQQDNNRLVDERRAADVHYRDMKVVYIAHPLSGPDRDANIARAARWCAWAFKSGYSTVADWIVLASQLDESYREQGLRADCALIKRCDELWQVGGRISDGMRIEAAAAKLVGVPVKDLTSLGEEPPEELISSLQWVAP